MSPSKDTDIAGLSFEQAVKELELIVRKLEAGQGELESSIADYERGVILKAHCMKKLADAKMKVEKIIERGNGEFSTVPFETASS